SWLTGTAAWSFVAMTNWILGIRPTYEGLYISPIIPKSWSGFQATRIFQGVKYHISVERVGKGNKSIIYINNIQIEGNVVSPPSSKIKEMFITVKIV
ncbi:MAG: glycosyl transferase, partial [Promethearchaeota archaeon]